jgi:Tfp pilus assembly protein PilX
MVLLVCLLFLTALTLLGLSSVSDTTLQKKLAANSQETAHARQSALAALAWAESWLLGQAGRAPEICTEPCEGLRLRLAGDLPPHPEFENLDWWLEHGHEAGVDPLTGNRIAAVAQGSHDTPVWIIESVHSLPATQDGLADLQSWYRILARGSGRTSNSVAVFESILVRSWPSVDEEDYTAVCPGSGATARCGRVAWRELR